MDAVKNELNQRSPQTPERAFERARKGVEAGEATYRTDMNDMPPAPSNS